MFAVNREEGEKNKSPCTLPFLSFRFKVKYVQQANVALDIKGKKEREGVSERALSTLRPGCIYYRLIVAEEVLYRVCSRERGRRASGT